MDLLERRDETRFLGREFLTWLWFRSETSPSFELEGGPVQVALGDRIELSDDPDSAVEEVVTVRGEGAPLQEARLSVREGKKVSSAKWRFTKDGNEWTVILDDLWLTPRSFRIPKVDKDEDEPDPDGFLLERVYLIEQGLVTLDALVREFISLRTSPEWDKTELPKISRWIEEGLAD